MTKKYIMSSLNIYILFINIILYLTGLYVVNLYSTKNIIIISIGLIITLFISIISYYNKKNIIYNSGIFITFLTNIILINNIISINQNYDYLNNLITNKYEYKDYSLYIQKKNQIYKDITKLENKKIGILTENYENTCKIMNKNVKVKCLKYNDISDLESSLQSGEIQAFIIEKSKYNNYNNKKSQTKEILSIKIKDPIY